MIPFFYINKLRSVLVIIIKHQVKNTKYFTIILHYISFLYLLVFSKNVPKIIILTLS